MRAVDFTRPTKFTAEQERRLAPHARGVLPHRLDAPVGRAARAAGARGPDLHPAHVGQRARRGARELDGRDLRRRADRHADAALDREHAAAGRDRAAARRVDRRRRQGTPHDRHRPGARPALLRAPARAAHADLDRRRRPRRSTLETVDQHMETAQMVSVSEPTLSLHDRGAPERHLRDAGAADPVVGDRAGRRPVRRRATTRDAARAATRTRPRCAAPSAASR